MVLFTCLLYACIPAPKPLPPQPQKVPEDFPSAMYNQAAKQGAPVYRIDTEKSLVVTEVYKGGSFAALGHDHVVASHDVHGYAIIPDNLSEGEADFYFPVSTLSVDEPELRAEAGFKSELSEKDMEGTRRNMLSKVLEAEEYPFVRIHVAGIRGDGPEQMADTTLNLHGQTHTLDLPLQIRREGQRVIATGQFHILQTDYGITPFSVLGGALAVKDELKIRFELEANPLGPSL